MRKIDTYCWYYLQRIYHNFSESKSKIGFRWLSRCDDDRSIVGTRHILYVICSSFKYFRFNDIVKLVWTSINIVQNILSWYLYPRIRYKYTNNVLFFSPKIVHLPLNKYWHVKREKMHFAYISNLKLKLNNFLTKSKYVKEQILFSYKSDKENSSFKTVHLSQIYIFQDVLSRKSDLVT